MASSRPSDSLPLKTNCEHLPPAKRLKISLKNAGKGQELFQSAESEFDENWREGCSSVRTIHNFAFRHRILTDVTFKVGEEGQEFHAHRIILALGSPVFEAMFYGALAERGNCIVIPDVHPDGFRHLLGYLYAERVSFTDYTSIFKTAFAAEKYCVTGLKEFCKGCLVKYQLDPGNAWVFLENSFLLNLESIQRHSLTYLKHNTEACMKHDSFLDASLTSIEEVLKLNALQAEEGKLLRAVLRWAQSRSSGNSAAENADAFRNAATPLLRHIRFGSLRPTEFVDVLQAGRLKEVLEVSDAFFILQHIVKPSLVQLPDWCCAESKRSMVSPEDLQPKRSMLEDLQTKSEASERPGISLESSKSVGSFTITCSTSHRFNPPGGSSSSSSRLQETIRGLRNRRIYATSSSSSSSSSGQSSSGSTSSDSDFSE